MHIQTCKIDAFALSVEKNSSLNFIPPFLSSVRFGMEHKASTRWCEEANVGQLTPQSLRVWTYMYTNSDIY